MKKFLFLACLVLPARAGAFDIPIDKDGVVAGSIRDIGVLTYTATNTATFLISGATVSSPANDVTGTTIAVHGVLTSTAPRGIMTSPAFVELRATDTANTSSELLVPPLIFSSGTYNTLYIFNPPLLVPENLSVTLTSAGTVATIFYNYLSTAGTTGDFWIPRDDASGAKAYDPNFYGVRAASNSYAGGAEGDRSGTETFDFTSDEKLVGESTTVSRGLAAPSHFWGWCASTGAPDTFLLFRDTNTTGSGAPDNLLLPPIFPRAGPFISSLSGNADNSLQSPCFQFPWPINTRYGLSMDMSVSSERFRALKRRKDRLP